MSLLTILVGEGDKERRGGERRGGGKADLLDISDGVHRDGLPLVSVSVAMCEVQRATDSPQATSAIHP